VRRAKGGLWFFSYDDFAGAVDWLRDNPEMARRMGTNGRQYVSRNYTWQAVAGRFQRVLKRWQSETNGAPR
jgi:glycosyltransferase involved in cell wall biosynthesis